MRRLFLYSFTCAFAIVGSVIGAGFVTGKEVFEFFAKDFSLSGMYLAFLCFTLSIWYVMNMRRNKVNKLFEIFVSIASIIVVSCMVSALDLLYNRLFWFMENVKIFSIFTAILLFIISNKGISAIEKFCAFTLPFVIVIIIVLCAIKIEDISVALSPKTTVGIYNPFVYVGFNVLLSSGIIKNSGEKLSPLFKIVASLSASFVICSCVFMLSLAVKKEGYNSEMPFVSLFFNNIKLLKIVDIITLFAIYSTLISSLYTVNSFGGIRLKLSLKILLLTVAICISFIGFSEIVEKLYPIFGIIAYDLFLASFLLSRPFLKVQQVHTSRLLRCRE